MRLYDLFYLRLLLGDFFLNHEFLKGFLFDLPEQLNHSVELKSIDFLSVFSRAEALAIFDEHVNATLFHEEFEVQGCIALSHCRIVKHSLSLAVPSRQVEFVTRLS